MRSCILSRVHRARQCRHGRQGPEGEVTGSGAGVQGPRTASPLCERPPHGLQGAKASWEGCSWEGRGWEGRSWKGSTWEGSDWEGSSWEGRGWEGSSWLSRLLHPGLLCVPGCAPSPLPPEPALLLNMEGKQGREDGWLLHHTRRTFPVTACPSPAYDVWVEGLSGSCLSLEPRGTPDRRDIQGGTSESRVGEGWGQRGGRRGPGLPSRSPCLDGEVGPASLCPVCHLPPPFPMTPAICLALGCGNIGCW